MSFHATALWRRYLAVVFLGLIAAPAAFGQLKDAQGNIISPIAFANQEAITTSFVTAPNLNTDTSAAPPAGEPGQWLKVEFHYGTTPVVTSAYPYVDSAEFKVWIEGLDLFAKNAPVPGQGAAVALTGSVTYVNIPMGKDIYGVFYVHPSVLARYSSDHGYTDFDRKFDIHIEAYVGGVLVDEVNKNKEDDPLNWFKPLTPISGLVYRQDQCPFLVSNSDRYPMIKPPASAP
jgi:hypothetical protein